MQLLFWNHSKGNLPSSEGGKQFQQKTSTSIDPYRILFIDITRGLLIFWMIAAHALTLSKIGRESYLYYIRPPGWASHGFIMLSGFGLAVMIIGRNLSSSALCNRLVTRAGQLFGWALASEFLSRLLVDTWLSHGRRFTLAALFDPTREWSISAFLIPTSILFVIAALVAPYIRAPRSTSLISLSIMAAIPASIFSSILQVPSFGIPVVLLVCFAFFGLGIGLLSKHLPLITLVTWLVPIGAVLLILRSIYPVFAVGFFVGTFLLTLSIAGILCMIPGIGFIRGFLGKMGRSALLLFIGHRFVLQAANALVKSRLQDWKLLLFLLVFGTSLLFSLCVVKERSFALRTVLRRIGL